jgi:sugar lactone lactonase YvrE
MTARSWSRLWAIILCLALVACGGGGRGGGSAPIPADTIHPALSPVLTVTPSAQTAVVGGDAVTLVATKPSAADIVQWSLEPGAPGSLDRTTGDSVKYLPPISVNVMTNTVINIFASSGNLTRKTSLVLESRTGGTIAPPPNTAPLPTFDVTVQAVLGAAGDVNITLSALRPASVTGIVLWRLEPDSPGSLDRSTGDSVVYTPPAPGTVTAGATATIIATLGGMQQTVTLPLSNNLGLFLLAGNSFGPGALDATGTAARFNAPTGVARDASGNLYVADTGNHTIRKIAANGSVTTLAGAVGIPGSANGSGAAARFHGPQGIAVDRLGNLYVTDSINSTIRKITANGAVTTLAGTVGMIGAVDGVGAAARFANPGGIAIDGAGNLYVADTDNATIRKITPNGAVSTLAGRPSARGSIDGDTASATFSAPRGIAVDAAGNVYVVDAAFYQTMSKGPFVVSSAIRRITPQGLVTTVAGKPGVDDYGMVIGSADGSGTEARFRFPEGIAVDANGNLYVADKDNETIRKITPDGAVTTLAGAAGAFGSTDGSGALARFGAPHGITVDATGTLYVAEAGNHAIRTVSPGGMVDTLAGAAPQPGSTDGSGGAALFNHPQGVAADAGRNLYVADTYNHTIRKITANGTVTTLAGTAGVPGSADGTGAAARFNSPQGVTIDAAGNLYVADTANATVRKITPAGAVTTLAGAAGQSGAADGVGPNARFRTPRGIAVDGAGNVYVADSAGATIRRITPAGAVTTLAGTDQIYGYADGTGANARFNGLQDITIDAAGNLYVVVFPHTVRKITPAGVVTTLADTAGTPGPAGVSGPVPFFSNPQGIAADDSGNLYVADTGNNAIYKVNPTGVVTVVMDGASVNQGGLYRPSRIAVVAPRLLAITAGDGVFLLQLP